MKPTFENSVNVLVQAYLSDTLLHGNCYACAVGNLVAAGMGYSFVRTKGLNYFADDCYKLTWNVTGGDYDDSFHAGWYSHVRGWVSSRDKTQGMLEVQSVGYTINELNRIETAFERATRGNSDDEWMFNGLMAVVDVLAEIHGINLEQKEEAKLLFVK